MRSFAPKRSDDSRLEGGSEAVRNLPIEVWEKYGLTSAGFLNPSRAEPRYASLPRAVRFRMALEELGGLYLLFGRFLEGRADVFPSPHLRQLRRLRISPDPAFRAVLDDELAGQVLEVKPLRCAPCSQAFEVRFRGDPVVVEVFRPYQTEGEYWEAFLRGIQPFENEVEREAVRPTAIEHFREWVELSGDMVRRRTLLENLEVLPEGALLRFPRLVRPLQSESCLAYEMLEGDPIQLPPGGEKLELKAKQMLERICEGFLEQVLLLSVIDASFDLDNYVNLGDGRLGVRTVPVLAPIHVEWTNEMLQYVTSTLSGNSTRAIHMLARMTTLENIYAGEQRLLRELSGLQPELKVNVTTPPSVTAFENYWRSLGKAGMVPPFFLQLFHRQATTLGQFNGEIAPTTDWLAGSIWPVVGRILRFRAMEFTDSGKVKEWFIGSGLVMLGAARQMGITLEHVRDNDLAAVLDHQEHRSLSHSRERTNYLIRASVALSILAVAVYVLLSTDVLGVRLAGFAVATGAALVFSYFVSRIN